MHKKWPPRQLVERHLADSWPYLANLGPMLWFFCRPKNRRKNWRFLTEYKAKLCKNLIMALVFEKNVYYFAENWRKSPKIVIITSKPCWPNLKLTL
jgi:hypothetical protein